MPVYKDELLTGRDVCIGIDSCGWVATITAFGRRSPGVVVVGVVFVIAPLSSTLIGVTVIVLSNIVVALLGGSSTKKYTTSCTHCTAACTRYASLREYLPIWRLIRAPIVCGVHGHVSSDVTRFLAAIGELLGEAKGSVLC